MERMISDMKKKEGVTEELKASDQIRWNGCAG